VLQRRSAKAITRLISLCIEQGRTKVSDKLIKNLSAFLCVDTSETPEFHPLQEMESFILSLKKEEEKKTPKDIATFERIAHEAKIKRGGAQAALEELSVEFDADLFTKIPRLKECMTASTIEGFSKGFPEDIKSDTSTFGQSIIDEFSVMRTLLPTLHPTLVSQLQEMHPHFINALKCKFSVIRFAAARCFATMCKVDIIPGMNYMVENVLPMVGDQAELARRQGAIECIYRIRPSSYFD
jgi:TATA-binding protein-associated factor